MFRLLLLALGIAAPVAAQPFTVVASQPADYAANVPLETTVSFTFSEPVADIGCGLGCAPPTVVFLPADSVEVGLPAQSGDGRTVSFPVSLRPSTRYVALVLAAQSADGDPLARPFALNYTTAPSAGAFTVSGTVSSAGGAPLDGTLVALVTGDLTTGDLSFAAVEVLDAAGGTQAYTLGPVPVGLYTVGAVRLPLDGGDVLFGFYDPNGDGVPDPILLPFGVDVTVREPAPITAGAYYEQAAAAAEGVVPDAYPTAIPSREVGTDGAAAFWIYTFSSNATLDDVAVVQVGFLSLPLPVADDVGGEPALAVPFVDTDAALATAQGAGGADFLAAHAGDVVTITASGNAGDPLGPIPVPFWAVHYEARDGQGGAVVATFGVFIDMATGALIGTTTAADPPAAPPGGLRVEVAPNPVEEQAAVAFTLDRPGRVRLAVYDLLGREVAVLVEGERPAGRLEEAWRPDGLAAGAYVVRLEVGGRHAARLVTLRR